VFTRRSICFAAAFLCVLLAGLSTAMAQDDWLIKKDEDDIKVFTRDDPNSAFKSIKVVCTVHAGMTQLAAALMDVDAQHEWMYNNKYAKLLKKIAPNELTFYSEVSVPWPYENRDFISHLTLTQPSPGTLRLDAHAEPDALPEKEGKVRVKKSVAHWEITKVGDQLLQIIYTVQFDPAGSVPAWLTNLFVSKGPYETFQNLRKLVSRPEYVHAQLDFIKE
jgi:uncharacterized protein YqfB (UPF0267 family)